MSGPRLATLNPKGWRAAEPRAGQRFLPHRQRRGCRTSGRARVTSPGTVRSRSAPSSGGGNPYLQTSPPSPWAEAGRPQLRASAARLPPAQQAPNTPALRGAWRSRRAAERGAEPLPCQLRATLTENEQMTVARLARRAQPRATLSPSGRKLLPGSILRRTPFTQGKTFSSLSLRALRCY